MVLGVGYVVLEPLHFIPRRLAIRRIVRGLKSSRGQYDSARTEFLDYDLPFLRTDAPYTVHCRSY